MYDRGIHFETVNLLSSLNSVNNESKTILHYIPSAYSTEQSSKNLIHLLQNITFEKLVVIFHGVYSEEEKRFMKDTLCPDQEMHLKLILEKSCYLVALSQSVKVNLESWLAKFELRKNILTLDHPGLFNSQATLKINNPYVFLGGISRAKKNCRNESTVRLIKMCKEQGLAVWMHWANLTNSDCYETIESDVWRMTNGLMSDQSWCNVISNSKVVLCPYETQIQSVSGLIAEAISAQSYILSTGFDYAMEMQERYPLLVFINNDIEQWPYLIEKIIFLNKQFHFNYSNWDDFADDLLTILVESRESIIVN